VGILVATTAGVGAEDAAGADVGMLVTTTGDRVSSTGALVGARVTGTSEGALVGTKVTGALVGTKVTGALDVGPGVGACVGNAVVGPAVGAKVVGVAVIGASEGPAVGISVTGASDGPTVGPTVGSEEVGACEGEPVGATTGAGDTVSTRIGTSVGRTESTGLPVGLAIGGKDAVTCGGSDCPWASLSRVNRKKPAFNGAWDAEKSMVEQTGSVCNLFELSLKISCLAIAPFPGREGGRSSVALVFSIQYLPWCRQDKT
jgi:hypothetical protein